MDNKTLPIPGREGGYVIQLTVFHQLHCLVVTPTKIIICAFQTNKEYNSQNLIRKGIYGAVDMTNEDDLLGIEHLDHCVDILRQSIMVSYSSCLPYYSTKLFKTTSSLIGLKYSSVFVRLQLQD